jgi:tRNA(fMet)-specific endonuclease VapC
VSYLLDTDTLSNLTRRAVSVALLRRLADARPEELFTSAITFGEMVYGALRSQRSETLLRHMEVAVWPRVRVLPFDTDAAFAYGRLRVALERAGTPIGEGDLRIAAVAVSRELTVVTANVRHFSRVPGLTVENWLAESA